MSKPTRAWLDASGCFLFGKHRGLPASDIAQDDPGYIRWVLDSVEDLADDDREVLETLIKFKSRLTR